MNSMLSNPHWIRRVLEVSLSAACLVAILYGRAVFAADETPSPAPAASTASSAASSPAPVEASALPAVAANGGASKVRLLVRLRNLAELAPKGHPGLGRPASVDALRTTAQNLPLSQTREIAPHLLAVTATRADLADITRNPLVESVSIDRLFKPALQHAIPEIHADAVQQRGTTGKGVLIAVLDTGVDSTHPALMGRVVEEACFSTGGDGATTLCPSGVPIGQDGGVHGAGAAKPCTLAQCEHGTHVAGIAAGARDKFQGAPISGVAPAASIIAIQVFSEITDDDFCGAAVHQCVGSYESDQILALQYLLTKYAHSNLAAVNMSLEDGGAYSTACDSDGLKTYVDQLRANGTLTVVAAGNEGLSGELSAPACISSAISVGAQDSQGSIPSFSNRAASVSIIAPGVGVFSAWPVAVGGSYHQLSGTSQATPFVTGTIALMKAAAPKLSGDDIANALVTGMPHIVVGNGASALTLQSLDANVAVANATRRLGLGVPASVKIAADAAHTANGAQAIVHRIVSVPKGLVFPSELLTDADKGLVRGERLIAPGLAAISAPRAVFDKLDTSMKVAPDRISKPASPE